MPDHHTTSSYSRCGVDILKPFQAHGPRPSSRIFLLEGAVATFLLLHNLTPPSLYTTSHPSRRYFRQRYSRYYTLHSFTVNTTNMSGFSEREVQLMACAFQAMKTPPEVCHPAFASRRPKLPTPRLTLNFNFSPFLRFRFTASPFGFGHQT